MKYSGPWWDEGARQAPLAFVRNGKGLVSYHLTLQRGTEWAATGQVTIPVPADVK